METNKEIDVINMYSQGYSMQQCAKEFTCAHATIKKILIKHNVCIKSHKEIFRSRRSSDEQIIDFYLQGNCQNTCIKELNISQKTLLTILRKYNIPIRGRSKGRRKLFCDDNYFNEINTENKAYFLGLLMTDGWNRKIGFGITLEYKDEDILDIFKRDIKYTGNLLYSHTKQGNKMVSLIVGSNQIANDLLTHGMLPAKTNILCFPTTVPKELMRHFMRGCFDGDGCISIIRNSLRFNIIGSSCFIEGYQQQLINDLSFSKTALYKSKTNHNIKTLHYGGNKQSLKLYEYFYKNATTFLKRKKEKFETGLANVIKKLFNNEQK